MPPVPRKKSKITPPAPKQPLQREPYQALVRALRKRSEELGLSVRALAERVGRPRTTVHKTLCGQRRMDPIEFMDWCEALEFDDPVALVKAIRKR